MQVILPSAFIQSKDKKKSVKSTSNSHVGTLIGANNGQFNYSMSPSKTGYMIDGKSVTTFKGQSKNQFNNGIQSFNGQNANIVQLQQSQNQQQLQGVAYLNTLSQSQQQNMFNSNNGQNQTSQNSFQQFNQNQLQHSQQLHQMQQQQQQQYQQQQIIQIQQNQQLNQAALSNNAMPSGGNFSQSAHQSSDKKQQNLQLQLQQQLQMQKQSNTFAKFKDLFGSKRLSEANAKQFLENSNFNSITNNSANFNKSSRLTAQLQVNKMTNPQASQNQNANIVSNNPKSIISPKRQQILNHGYIIEDKKKKTKQFQEGIINQQQQALNLQQQALLSASQPYFKINRDASKQPIPEDNKISNSPNNNQNVAFANSTISGSNNQIIINQNKMNNNQTLVNQSMNINSGNKGNLKKQSMSNSINNGTIDYNQSKNIDINKLAEYKKQLESQLENVNNYIDSIKNFSTNPQYKNLTINIDAPQMSQDEKNKLLSKKLSLDEIVVISAPQSVRNTKDSNHNSNSTTQGSTQHINNLMQMFNLDKQNGIAAVSVKDESHQGELNGSTLKNQHNSVNLQAQAISNEAKLISSQKMFPKTATSRDTTQNQTNGTQQFFMSTKAQQNKTHIKRLTLDSTFSQTLQSQRMPTSNNQLSSILSQSTHHFNQAGQQLIVNPHYVNQNIVQNEQDFGNNLQYQLNKLKERIMKVLTNYKMNKEQSDKLNQQLIVKISNLQSKNNSQQQILMPSGIQNNNQQIGQTPNQIYHAKSNSFQQLQLPQQAMPLHPFNNQPKLLSQSQQFFLQKNSENQMQGGGQFINQNALYGSSQSQANINTQNQNQNPNQMVSSEQLKKEYYSNSNNINQLNHNQIMQQHNGNSVQQHIIIDSLNLGQNSQNNINYQVSSKNTSQSPQFTTSNKQKNHGGIMVQSPSQHVKQFQFFNGQMSNNGQRIPNNQINNQQYQQSYQMQQIVEEKMIQ
ncbi:hypothetical protein ABPG72_005123 [Tetrahymena utriculariae]